MHKNGRNRVGENILLCRHWKRCNVIFIMKLDFPKILKIRIHGNFEVVALNCREQPILFIKFDFDKFLEMVHFRRVLLKRDNV